MRKLTMKSVPDLRISQLLAARLCHELVGPITAVANGADLLCDDGLEADQEALALVGESARRAASRLEFFRFAYGFVGDGRAAGPSPGELAAEYFKGSRIFCRYGDEVRSLPLIQQQLACNLLVIGAEALGRGGVIAVESMDCGIRLEAAGEDVSMAREQSAALTLMTPVVDLTARTVHGYFTGLLAWVQGWQLVEVTTPGRLYITLLPPAG
jgi:histidine phosphotransferase ChpT